MDMVKDMIKIMGCKLLLGAFHSSLLASLDMPKLETTERVQAMV
jgi:hypothetical protein